VKKKQGRVYEEMVVDKGCLGEHFKKPKQNIVYGKTLSGRKRAYDRTDVKKSTHLTILPQREKT